jgi:uncharacterized membrane protein
MSRDLIAYLSPPFLGLLLVLLGRPLARRRVPPNGMLGLRIPSTYASPSVWYGANARAGADLVLLGAALMVTGLLLPWIAGTTAFVIEAVLGCAGLVVIYLRAVSHAQRLLEGELRDRAERPARP